MHPALTHNTVLGCLDVTPKTHAPRALAIRQSMSSPGPPPSRHADTEPSHNTDHQDRVQRHQSSRRDVAPGLAAVHQQQQRPQQHQAGWRRSSRRSTAMTSAGPMLDRSAWYGRLARRVGPSFTCQTVSSYPGGADHLVETRSRSLPGTCHCLRVHNMSTEHTSRPAATTTLTTPRTDCRPAPLGRPRPVP